jgi:hypothetical protein
MPSAQDCAERLREQAYRALLPQIQDLEEELQKISSFLSTGMHQIGRKLEALRHIELPTTEFVLGEVLEEAIRQKTLETDALIFFGRGLRQRETQEEILTFLLESAQKFFPHIALFVVRGDRFIGWSSRGYSETLAKNISSCSFLRSECPQFQKALESEIPIEIYDLPDHDPLQLIQQEAQGPWQLMPLHAMKRPLGLLLAGGSEEIPGHPDALSLLIDFTALRLENIALKILYELTTEKVESVPQPMTAAVSALAEAALEPSPAMAVPAAPPVIAQEQPEEPIETAPDLKFEPEPVQEEAPAEAALDLSFEPEPVQEPAPSTGGAAVEIAQEETAVQVEEHPEIPIPVPQPEVVQAQKPEALRVPEEEKLHSDAKRFARLLVSEIKLYNEHHVVEGRENRDLYLRLKQDIDRSREMYEKRVSPAVSRKIDYFHDEIIRILGDNDPSTLGSDYPGPRVES